LVTQIIGGASILSIMWHVLGYTLVYGHTWGGFIGNFENILMIGVPYDDCSRHAPNIPAALYGFFQMMFAAITPLLMTGAFAERLKFKAYIIFIIVWEIIVYYPVAHWNWGDGWMSNFGVELSNEMRETIFKFSYSIF
jgi:Amt family ammonium transporter